MTAAAWLWSGVALLTAMLGAIAVVARRRAPVPPTEAELRESWERQLRDIVTALASPGEAALAHAGVECVRADELALEWSNARDAYLGWHPGTPGLLRERLDAIERVFDTIQQQGDPAVWDDEAVLAHPLWAEVREAAGRALDAFGWPRPVA